jgi:hypothetical protein
MPIHGYNNTELRNFGAIVQRWVRQANRTRQDKTRQDKKKKNLQLNILTILLVLEFKMQIKIPGKVGSLGGKG